MAIPATIPVDEAARSGLFQLVFGGDAEFACARWNGEAWVFSSNRPLPWQPERYAPTGGIAAHGRAAG